VRWHAKAEYQPQSIGSKYDFQQSGGKPITRNLDLHTNNEETWAWTIQGSRDFKGDTSDLIFYLGYDTDLGDKAETDVWREKVKWIEKNDPGFAKKAWTWFTANLTLFLGVLVGITSIWASVKTVQVRKLEIEKNALGRPLPAVVKDLVGSEQEPSGEPGCNVDGSKDETKVKLGPVKD